ncbi:MAG: hypothetical protein V4438_04475 [Patescibacteria group bacterium]
MKKYIFALALVSVALIPIFTFAADDLAGHSLGGAIANQAPVNIGSCMTPRDFATLFDYVLCLLVSYVTPFLFGLGGVIFIIGVVSYVRAGDNEEKRAAGRDLMWFGIIALFVMISVWGFVSILTRSFFGTDASFPSLPRRATSVFQQ